MAKDHQLRLAHLFVERACDQPDDTAQQMMDECAKHEPDLPRARARWYVEDNAVSTRS
jgi:hypothetical protein